jgi:subtilisin family serine protease
MHYHPWRARLSCWLLLALSWTGTIFLTVSPRPAILSPPLLPAFAEQDAPGGTTSAPLGNIISERTRLLARLGVERWHQAGFKARGIKIAVLDSGFRGYRGFLGNVLPARLAIRSFRRDHNLEARDSQHGILCGEVVHALAPDADLIFANWDAERPDEFLAAVAWARQQGARILTCSLIMPTWSDGEGGGPTHAALTRLLGSGENPGAALLFASAGNTAQRHWSGPYHSGERGFHEWRPGQLDNEVTPWGDGEVSVELCWRVGANFDLDIFDTATGHLVAQSPARHNVERSCAVARFLPEPGHRYRVRVRLARGPASPFHIVALGGSLAYVTQQGSIAFPADGPAVIAVGAVDEGGQRIAYSSCGPNSTRPKPDLVAPVPFPTLCRSRPFAGTSAAAPQAAALAALLWGRHPDWSAARVRDTLRASAHDLGTPGHDYETGYGLITLP